MSNTICVAYNVVVEQRYWNVELNLTFGSIGCTKSSYLVIDNGRHSDKSVRQA